MTNICPSDSAHFIGHCHQIFDLWFFKKYVPHGLLITCLYFYILVLDFTEIFVNSEKRPAVYTSGGPGVDSCRGKMQRGIETVQQAAA
jgi:hypothetical protein